MIAPYLELARAHALVLVVAAPLCGAALLLVLPSGRLGWLVAVAAAVGAAALACDFSARALLGGAPLGIFSVTPIDRPDGVALFAIPIVTCASAVALIAAGAQLRDYNARAAPFALALTLCVGAGWTGALLARDFTGLFLAGEAAWLAATGLVALGAEKDRGGLNAALRMLVAGGMSAALMLLGIGLIVRSIGSVDLAALPIAQIAASGPASAGAGLILLALALKASLAPFHLWSGAAQGRASALGAIVIGAVGAAGALAVMTRMAAFAIPAPAIGGGVSAALAGMGAASVVIGSLQAIGAGNLRRLVAYAGAAQAGIVLLGVALGSPAGFAAALIQLGALAAAAMAVLAGLAAAGGGAALGALDGLGRRAPLSSLAITAGALSLMGAPLTIGFLGRWRVIEAALGAGWWWAAGAVIGASLAGVFYGGRLIERLYFRRAASALEGRRDPWRLALAPALAAGILGIAIGVAPGVLLLAADAAASQLAGEAS